MVKDANTASDRSIGRSGSMGSNGDIILGWVNSTKSSTCINFQNVLTVNAATGEWEVGEAMRVDMLAGCRNRQSFGPLMMAVNHIRLLLVSRSTV